MALTYVRLIWRVLDVIGDTSDPDHLPDDSPLPDKTSLTLTMAAATIIDLSERPAITHYPQPIPCTVDSQGNMLDPQGNIGVYIIDPTNQTLQPHDWTISLRLEVPGRPTKTWSVKLTIAEPDDPALPGVTTYDVTRNGPVPQYAGSATDASVYATAAAGSATAAAGSASDAAASAASVQRGLPGGVASLDDDGLVPVGQVPDLSGVYGRVSARVANLTFPLIAPHRGAGAQCAPPDTMPAMRLGASYGYGAIDGGDWQTTSDGCVVSYHDPTLGSETSAPGRAVASLSLAAAQLVTIYAMPFGGGWPDSTIPTVSDVFDAFGGRVVLLPEPKDDAAAPILAAEIRRRGIADCVIPNSFSESRLLAFTGCKWLWLNLLSMPDESDLDRYAAEGITILGAYEGLTAANIATLKQAGFLVASPTMVRHCDIAAAGLTDAVDDIDIWVCDDPLYFASAVDPANAARYLRTADPFADQTYYPGMLCSYSNTTRPASRGYFLGGNRYGWGAAVNGKSPEGSPWALQGWACPLASPTAWTMRLNITFDALGSDASRWGGVFVCQPTDDPHKDVAGDVSQTGYQMFLRANGSLTVQSSAAGVYGTPQIVATTAVSAPLTTTADLPAAPITAIPVTALATALASGVQLALPTGQIATLSAAAAAGETTVTVASITPTSTIPSGTSIPQTVPLKVQVTDTQIIATRIDTGHSVTLTDSTARGPYFHFGGNGANLGLHWSFSAVTITTP